MKRDNLTVKILSSRDEMGAVAAKDIYLRIQDALKEKQEIHMIFAAAPSQNEVLENLLLYSDIEWDRIHAFHMDEYIGLPKEQADKSFGSYLAKHIFDRVPFRSVNYINSASSDAEGECERYARLLQDNPTDIVVMGIGENGHIAFNDPWVADFHDPQSVKVVKLDEMCRNQQVNDGCFAKLQEVPTHAITLTCPQLFAAKSLFCVVPSQTKAKAVERTLNGEISEECPATILRKHGNATLYLDGDSSLLL